MLVSQFTLYADARRGRRPSFTGAAPPALAEPLVDRFKAALADYGLKVAGGVFGAYMQVELLNDGPVTIWLDSEALFPVDQQCHKIAASGVYYSLCIAESFLMITGKEEHVARQKNDASHHSER